MGVLPSFANDDSWTMILNHVMCAPNFFHDDDDDDDGNDNFAS
jgi:hypothetical protein